MTGTTRSDTAGRHMGHRLHIPARPSSVITGVFRVCDITRYPRLRDDSCFELILASGTTGYAAIAGQSAAQLDRGDLVRVQGCLLIRRGRMVLVAGSLKRIAHRSSRPIQLHRHVAVD